MSLVRFIAPFSSNFIFQKHPLNSFLACQTLPKFNHLVTKCAQFTTSSSTGDTSKTYRWRPMCLYFTHGKCTKMDDAAHLEVFNHDCSRDLPVNPADFERKRPQDFDFFLVFDLEGKVEILEFPVLIIDAKTMAFVDLFHRFVRPTAMSEQRINEYIENKYGKFGVDRVWHDTALPFNEVIQEFEAWLTLHNLWEKKHGGCLNRAAFVTCGNWDVKTQIPRQCAVSKARGMRTMMQQLKLPVLGSHHLGIDDTKNVARVLQRMVADGAVIPITAWRNLDSIANVHFLYKNRI
ncbi:uncharacterized exonuclease domain-containing protein At3g15140 isoform X2 [Mercurialis annua]|uniref:uncharacterized exonuclease domain-containing protein At3g15140 isoform X2 n=1 Tax=Mercurialis annua TaxID=3986 RepID=UPI00215F9602|nr:uncharacterized exonuclease domain-containing protein At3g15140 isoform X2 [Mercurialis annua]